MICSGILPIDQMRDHTPPVSLVCQRIPRVVLEQIYGIVLPLPPEGEDFDRAPYADELLSAFGRECANSTYFSKCQLYVHLEPDLASVLW